MLISCVLQCTDGLRLIKRLENYAYRMSEKTAYRSLEKSAYRSLKKLLTVHLQIHLTACRDDRFRVRDRSTQTVGRPYGRLQYDSGSYATPKPDSSKLVQRTLHP